MNRKMGMKPARFIPLGRGRDLLLLGLVLAGPVLPAARADGTPSPTRAAGPAREASLEERMVLAAPTEAEAEDGVIAGWQNRIKAGQLTPGNFERLGWAYVAKARRTLDAGYYQLAGQTADAMDARFGPTDEALLLRGHVDHNLHRFRAAEGVARELVARRGLAFDYGLLSDALMEQGRLPEAVAACAQMMRLKPGLEAYSRAANLRWLTGDLPGAIQAMEAAVRAGSPLDATNAAWTLSRLSGYYGQAGRNGEALAAAEAALRLAPEYPPALLGRGRALVALGQTEPAIPPLRLAEWLNPLPEYQWWLADALRLAGRTDEAAAVEARLEARGAAADPRTFALFLATRGREPVRAVELARAELLNRGDVFTEDALAWALAQQRDYPGAEAAIQRALASRTRDARLFLHAGEIALRRGQPDSARAYFAEALPLAGTLTPSERALLDRVFPSPSRPTQMHKS
jgi:tetratricopeptide (TPR) repeat protein